MKKFLNISALFLMALVYGQNVSDYQYIYVPEKFNDFDQNKYGLNDLLQTKLKQKKFIILTQNKTEWPLEAQQDPCQILSAEAVDTSNMFKNRIKIDFKDCQNKTVASLEGKSSIKEFDEGMRDALQIAIRSVAVSNPVKKSVAMQKEESIKAPQPVEEAKNAAVVSQVKTAQVVPAPKTEATADQKAEVYHNGSLMLNRIFLSNGEFILVNPNNSVPYATFKPSTKKEVYRVQLNDGTATIGYLENSNIIVELTNNDGSFRKAIFEKK